MSKIGVCTAEMAEYLKWRSLPLLKKYIHSQFRCEQAFKYIAEAEQSEFENKEALKKASAVFFDVLRQDPCIQGYLGLAYLFLLLEQGENAIRYLAAAQKMNPYDNDIIRLMQFVLKEKPELQKYIQPPSFKDDEDYYNYQDDHPSIDNINHLEELPSELLVQIFSWLKPTSVTKFREVSKFYRDLLVNNVYWQEQCANRWTPIDPDDLKKLFKGQISNDQYYYRYYQNNHNVHVNWLNRATKFEEIKNHKGEAVEFFPSSQCCAQTIFTLHLHQRTNDQIKRSIEFFRIKSGKMHRIKRLHVDIDCGNWSGVRSTSTSTADHVITCTSNGTLVLSDINKRESKIHRIDSAIEVISGLPGTNGVKFLAAEELDGSIMYYDGINVTKTVRVCDPNYRVLSMSTQRDGKTAILAGNSALNRHVKIFDTEAASVIDTLALASTHQRVEWMDAMPDVLMGLDSTVTFYDTRTKNKFVVPRKEGPSQTLVIHSVAMDDSKLFAQSSNALTLFDCRYSSSIVDKVPLPQQHASVPGLGLWGVQKMVYSSKQHLIEWDLGQIIKPVK